MIKPNFFVITGGPGSGKTTLLQALLKKGLQYVPETARAIIQRRIAAGLTPRPSPVEFAVQILETDIHNFTVNTPVQTPLLFDRAFIDSAAMLYEADKKKYAEFPVFIQTHRFNSIAFFAPPWKEIYVNDAERDQTFDDAVIVYHKLYNWYTLHGYQPIPLPRTSVEDRVAFVMAVINDQHKCL